MIRVVMVFILTALCLNSCQNNNEQKSDATNSSSGDASLINAPIAEGSMSKWLLISKEQNGEPKTLTKFSKTVTVKYYNDGYFLVEGNLEQPKKVAEGQWELKGDKLIRSYNNKMETLKVIELSDTILKVTYDLNGNEIIDTYRRQ